MNKLEAAIAALIFALAGTACADNGDNGMKRSSGDSSAQLERAGVMPHVQVQGAGDVTRKADFADYSPLLVDPRTGPYGPAYPFRDDTA